MNYTKINQSQLIFLLSKTYEIVPRIFSGKKNKQRIMENKYSSEQSQIQDSTAKYSSKSTHLWHVSREKKNLNKER